jgi:predicted ATP-grasp superfamily ATP-dependent carboligase
MYRKPYSYSNPKAAREDSRLQPIFDSDTPVAFVFPVSFPVGMSVIRTLSESNVPILALDFKADAAGLFSRAVTGVHLPHMYDNQEAFLEHLLVLGERFRVKPVLFLNADEYLFFALKNRDKLEKFFRFPLSPWSTVESIVNKGKLYRVCQSQGFPMPKTWFIDAAEDLDRVKNELQYPCIIKPTYSTQFRRTFDIKAKKFSEFKPLKDFAQDLMAKGIPFVIQEFIEGDQDTLYTFAAYSTDGGEVLASFTGRKVHQFPPDFGTCRLGESIHDPELEALGQRLLKMFGYRGISLTEFKKSANGDYKLIETNTRPGGWPERLAQLCGANLVLSAYHDAIGKKVPIQTQKHYGVKWANLSEDFYYCVRGYRLLGYPKAHKGLMGWLKDLKGLKTGAFFAWDDPVPSLVRFKGVVSDFMERERKIQSRKKGS